jgi:Flp pilus assembly protein TadG
MVRRRQSERGAIAVLAALLVMVLGGFLALTLDLGHKFNARAQLEGAGDSAALAGARTLSGMSAGLSDARQIATTFATNHFLDSSKISVNTNNDVVVGFWDKANGRFYTDGDTIPDLGDADITLDPGLTPQYYNAVKVITAADGQPGHNNPLNVFFGYFVGFSGSLTSKSTVVAAGGGPCDENHNILPLIVPSCAIADGAGSTLCDQTVHLSFNWGGGHDIAFADLTPPSGVLDENQDVVPQLNDAIAGDSPQMNTFVPVAVGNGAGFSSTTINLLQSVVCGGDTSTCPTYVIPVANVGTNCTAAMPSHTTPVGFTNVVVRNVTWIGGTRTVDLFIACDRRASDQRGGCAHFGFPSQYLASLVK